MIVNACVRRSLLIMPETADEKAERLQRELDDARAQIAQASGRVESYRVPKLPPFSRLDPGLWFTQVEASFRRANITTEGTKADHVITTLDHEAMMAIREIAVLHPQPNDVFTQIKARLVASFSASTESKLRQLLKGQVLLDGKPSLILNRLRGLDVGSKCDESIIKSVFLDQLQPNHRAIILASGVDDLSQLALLADKITENSPADSRISGVAKEPDSYLVSTEIKKLSEQFSKFAIRLENVEKAVKSKDRANQRSRSRSRDPSGLCFAHKKYPDNPTSCKKWCMQYAKWSAEN